MQALLERCGNANRVLTEADRYAMFRLAEGARLLMDKRANDLVDSAAAHNKPVLSVYMSDGWASTRRVL